MTENTDIWQLDPHVRHRRLLDEAVVIHQDRAEALVLNDTAVTFLELCDGQRDYGEILALMTERFEVGREVLENDLSAFVQSLAEDGIIHRVAQEST